MNCKQERLCIYGDTFSAFFFLGFKRERKKLGGGDSVALPPSLQFYHITGMISVISLRFCCNYVNDKEEGQARKEELGGGERGGYNTSNG